MSHLPFTLSRGTKQLMFIMLQLTAIIIATCFLMFLFTALTVALGLGALAGQQLTLISSLLSLVLYLTVSSNQNSSQKHRALSSKGRGYSHHIQPHDYHQSPRFSVGANHLHEAPDTKSLTDQLAFPGRRSQQ